MQKEKSLQVYRGIWLFVTRYCCKAIVPYLNEKIKFIKAKFIIDKPRNKFAFYFAYFNRPYRFLFNKVEILRLRLRMTKDICNCSVYYFCPTQQPQAILSAAKNLNFNAALAAII